MIEKVCLKCGHEYNALEATNCIKCGSHDYREKPGAPVVIPLPPIEVVVVKPEEPAHAKVEKKTRRGLFGG